MQSTLFTPYNKSCFHFQWKFQHFQSFHTKPTSEKLSLSTPRSLIFTNSLRTSINYQPEEGLNDGSEPQRSPVRLLPVVVRDSGRVSRYYWDEESNNVKLVSVGGSVGVFYDSGGLDLEDGIKKLFRVLSLGFRDLFIPKKISENYLDYVKWSFLHRVFSSALQVLATQAMFRAIGIGYSRSLPSAAALNWVLKDGLGRLSRCIYTASFASAFDTNLKRVRFSTSVIYSLSIGVELLTPVFPQQFLLLATIANIAKQIGLACYLATDSAVYQSFAVSNNLGEVSAKAQIQTVCFDNLGLMLAALLNMLFKNNQRLLAGLPFVVYPIFSAIDLFGIYQGLKHVHLQTLTKDRLEIILNSWIELGRVPSPSEVSKVEGIDFLRTKGKELWPIRIGFLKANSQIPKLSMPVMQSLSSEDYYFICLEDSCRGLKRNKEQGILLSLREDAGTGDIIRGLLQACYIRKALHSGIVHKEWIKLIEDSKQSVQRDMLFLEDQMSAVGWATKNVLLSTKEQVRYSFADE